MAQQQQKQEKTTKFYSQISPSEKESLKDLMNRMLKGIHNDNPENITTYLINFLKEEKGYRSSGLSFEEDSELNYLRDKVSLYRDLDEFYKINPPQPPTAPPAKNVQPPVEEPLSDEEDDTDINKELDNIDYIKKTKNEISHRNAIYIKGINTDPDKPLGEPRSYPKPPELVNVIKSRICHNFLFNCLDEIGVSKVIDSMEEKKLKSGQTLFKQNEISDNFYFLFSGKLDCHRKASKETPELLMKIILPNEIFGEINLIFPSNCSVTVKASVDSVVYILNRTDYNLIKQKLFFNSNEKYYNCLKKIEILNELKDEDLIKLSELVLEGAYTQGDMIFKEGQSGNVLYYILEGECVAVRKNEPGKTAVELKIYKQGEYIDELSILYGVIRSYTLIAKTDIVRLLGIDLPTIKKEFGEPTLVFKNRHEIEQERILKEKEEYMNRLYEKRYKKKRKKPVTPKIIAEKDSGKVQEQEPEPASEGEEEDNDDEDIMLSTPNGLKGMEGKAKKDLNALSDSDESFEVEGGLERKGRVVDNQPKEEIKEESGEQEKEVAKEPIQKPAPHQFPKGEIEEIGDKDGNKGNN